SQCRSLTRALCTFMSRSSYSMNGLTIRDERQIATAVRFIDLHFRRPLSLEELSALVGIISYHFLRTFKQVVGLTPHQYVSVIRANSDMMPLKRGQVVLKFPRFFHRISKKHL
ncbi:MAG: AraC family transcriptional regulator, partial [Blastocatellia bacterium]